MLSMLLAAATVAAGPAAKPQLLPGTLREVKPSCSVGVMPVDRMKDITGATKLGDLPKAHLMLPVNRMVDGCPVPTFVQYNVEGDGRAARPR